MSEYHQEIMVPKGEETRLGVLIAQLVREGVTFEVEIFNQDFWRIKFTGGF